MDELALRRLLLDGVNILQPYLRALNTPSGGDDQSERMAIEKEIALVSEWLRRARGTALKLRRTVSANGDG